MPTLLAAYLWAVPVVVGLIVLPDLVREYTARDRERRAADRRKMNRKCRLRAGEKCRRTWSDAPCSLAGSPNDINLAPRRVTEDRRMGRGRRWDDWRTSN